MASILRSLTLSATASTVIRTSGTIASGLLCLHSLSFLTAPTSMFHLLHNLADLFLFLLFGFSGLVAELFPRDSLTYKLLKANFPFLITLIGRGVFYLVLGFLVMGDYGKTDLTPTQPKKHVSGEEDDGEPTTFWGYFTVVSGVYISLVGIGLVYTALRNRNRRTLLQGNGELSQPIVAFVPSMPPASAPQMQVVVDQQLETQEGSVRADFPTAV